MNSKPLTPNKGTIITLSIFALLVSLLAGFFVVLNAIFSDVFTYGQHLQLFLFTFGVYVILTGSFALVLPADWHRWIHIFSWPAIIFAAVFSISEFGPRIILHATYALIAVDGAALATWLAARLRKKVLSDEQYHAITQRMKTLLPYLGGAMALGIAVSAFLF